MRYVLAIAFACAIGVPAAFAMPAAFAVTSPSSLSKSTSTVQMVKHTNPRNVRQSRRNNTGGIHPLVGSGDY